MDSKLIGRLVLAFALASPINAFAQDVSFPSLPVLQTNQQPGSTTVPNDIDGSGTSDLLWFNPGTSQFGYWLMSVDNNGNVTRRDMRTINTTPGYFVAATGDFNNDGKVDVIWTSANHDLYLWTGTGMGFQSNYLDSYPAGWTLIGAGDVDGDGVPDLLWVNQSTHQFAYWLMKGGKRVGSKTINFTPGYNVVAIGYFSQSNRISLVWVDDAGDLYDWDSNGTGFTSYYMGSIARSDAQYKIDGIALRAGGYLAIETVSSSLYQYYSWVRQFDSSGNPTTSSFFNGAFGGRMPNAHISGFIYCPQFTSANQSPLFVYTDVGDFTDVGNPQITRAMIGVNSPYQFAGLSSSDSLWTSYPVGWYVIGARSNQSLP